MNYKETWQSVLTFLERDLSKGVIATFFGTAELAEIGEGRARILCPNRMALEQLRAHQSQLAEAFRTVCGEDHQFSFEIKPLVNTLPQDPGTLFHHAPPNGLADSYSFENFVVGISNQLAVGVARAVAEQPGAVHNRVHSFHSKPANGGEFSEKIPQRRRPPDRRRPVSGLPHRFPGRILQHLQ